MNPKAPSRVMLSSFLRYTEFAARKNEVDIFGFIALCTI